MIKRFTNLVLYTSIPISIGSSALIVRTFNLYDIKVNWSLILFTFFSTLFTYNLSKIIPLWNIWNSYKDDSYAYNERNNWNFKNKKTITFLTIFSFLLLILLITKISFYQLIFLTHLGIISVFYSAPLFSGKAVRNLPFIKIFLISYVWACVSILPLVYKGFSLNNNLINLFLENFCFIMAITIPFDIRDYTRDKSQGVKTIPLVFGVKNARLIAILFLILSTIIGHFIFKEFSQNLANICLNFLLLPVLIFSKENNGEMYFLGLIDSTLILRLLIFYV